MAPISRIPGTVGTDISEDRKGDPSRVTPAQPDLHVEEDNPEDDDSKAKVAPAAEEGEKREALDDAVEEEPWVDN